MATVLHSISKLVIMARYYKYWAVSCWLLAVGMLFSCQEGGEAGDLLGQWRMVGTDTHYMAFSGSLTVFRMISGSELKSQVYGNFQHQGDSIFIQCYSIKGDPSDTLIIENTFGFRPFNNIRLKIDRLDDDNLVLSKDNQRWSFYKY